MARKRRSYTPGSIYAKQGKLVIDLKGKKYCTGFNDTPEGREKAKQMKEQLYEKLLKEKDLLPDRSKDFTTILEAFNIFIKHLERLKRSQKTIVNYKLAFKSIFTEDYLISKKIGNEYQIIYSIRSFIDNSNIENTSKNIYLRAVRSFLNYSFSQGYISQINVMKMFGQPEKERKPIAYNDKDLDCLLEYFNAFDEEFALWLSLMRETGARCKESLSLKWDQIDFNKRTIKLFNKTNTNKSEIIVISKRTNKILDRLKEISETKTKDKQKVFRWSETSMSRLTRRVHKAERILGIEQTEGCFHKLRKAFATEIIEKDLPIYQVKELMRHSDINTTLKYYKEKDTQKLVDAMNRIRP